MDNEITLMKDGIDFFAEGKRLIENNYKIIAYLYERNYWEHKYEGIPLENLKLTSVEQIARDYGFSEEEFFKLLVELDIYKPVTNGYYVNNDYVTEGYTKSTFVRYDDSEGVSQLTLDTKWTPKGYSFLQGQLKKLGRFKLTRNENL